MLRAILTLILTLAVLASGIDPASAEP